MGMVTYYKDSKRPGYEYGYPFDYSKPRSVHVGQPTLGKADA